MKIVTSSAIALLLAAGLAGAAHAAQTSEWGSPDGEPFLAAVTTSTTLSSPVPELSTWTMMIAGFAGLGWLGYSRRHAIRSAAA